MPTVLKLVLAIALCTATLAHAADWEELNAEAIERLQSKEVDEGLDLAKRALWYAEREEGAESPAVATTLSTLGRLLEEKKESAEAKKLYFRALRIRVVAFGVQHQDVAKTLYNLAILYDGAKNYDEAKALYEKALEITIDMNGADDPMVGKMLVGLGSMFVRQKQYVAAEPLLNRGLQILETALGKFDLAVASAVKNLAFVYKNTGRLDFAKEFDDRATAIRAIPRDVAKSVSI